MEVRRDARFVDGGQTLTSGPVSTGIDLALHFVARLDSVDVARQVAEYPGYTPDPVCLAPGGVRPVVQAGAPKRCADG